MGLLLILCRESLIVEESAEAESLQVVSFDIETICPKNFVEFD